VCCIQNSLEIHELVDMMAHTHHTRDGHTLRSEALVYEIHPTAIYIAYTRIEPALEFVEG
jgi:hypothetical protein